jgi:C-terminal processing protease CtpA/Prc
MLRTKSLYRNNVDWAALRDSVNRRTRDAKTIRELMPAIVFIYEAIGDNHGFLAYKGRRYDKGRDFQPRSELAAGFRLGNRIRIAMIDKKTGYVSIPGNPFSGEAANKHAQQIQDSICKLDKAGAKNWIVDLRMNLGGNMHPMIAGLSGILDEGVLGYFIGPNGEKSDWKLRDGVIYSDDKETARITKGCKIEAGSRVAVLISQITSSSGEVTAISFKGRPNTKFFGENTAGAVTANEAFDIDKNSMLVVATSFEADRNNVVYKDFVRPDVLMIDGDNFNDLRQDKKIQAALQWLQSSE